MGVEAVIRAVREMDGIVRAPLPVAGDVADHRAVHEAFGERKIALQVRGVVLGVPETPLDVREDLDALRLGGIILQRQHLQLGVVVVGDEHEQVGGESLAGGPEAGVAEPVTALVAVERGARRPEARVPGGVAVDDVQVLADAVERHAVVAVARQAAELCVPVEAVATAGVRHDGMERLAAEVVDPGQRRQRLRDHVLALAGVEVSVGARGGQAGVGSGGHQSLSSRSYQDFFRIAPPTATSARQAAMPSKRRSTT
jgi:hypothetical protein